MHAKSLVACASGLLLALSAATASAQWPFPITGDSDQKPTLAPLLREVTPAVVNIAVEARAQAAVNPLFNDPLLERFFGFQMPQEPQQPQPRMGAGSGVIIDAENGYVLTNHHVVAEADRVRVTLADGREVDADIIGSDEGTDIALLQIEADGLTALELSDSDALEVGDFVIAIGNPFGLGQTVTSGIVSALGRSGLNPDSYEDFIQTDASINPGNSGGALVDLDGRLVGINSAIISAAGGNVGIGFAVPSNMAGAVMDQLLEYGEVRRGRLGVMIGNLSPDIAEGLGLDNAEGALIREVDPGSPAEEAGLQAGDVIVEFDNEPIDSYIDLRNKVALKRLGSSAGIVYYRDGARHSTEATIGRESGGQLAAGDGRTVDKLQGAEFRTLDRRDEEFGRIQGVVITRVDDGSPAARNGLVAGDIITAVNRRPVRTAEDLAAIINETRGTFLVFLIRDGRRLALPIQ